MMVVMMVVVVLVNDDDDDDDDDNDDDDDDLASLNRHTQTQTETHQKKIMAHPFGDYTE